MRLCKESDQEHSKEGMLSLWLCNFFILFLSAISLPFVFQCRFDFDLQPVNLVTVLNENVKFLEISKLAFGESYSREIRNQSMDFYMTLGYFYESKRDFYESNYNHSLLILKPHLHLDTQSMRSVYEYYIMDPSNYNIKNLNDVQQNLVFQTPLRNSTSVFQMFNTFNHKGSRKLFKHFINIYVLPLYASNSDTSAEINNKLNLELVLDLHFISLCTNKALAISFMISMLLFLTYTMAVWISPKSVFKSKIMNCFALTLSMFLYCGILLLNFFNIVIVMIMIEGFGNNNLTDAAITYDFIMMSTWIYIAFTSKDLIYKSYQFTQGKRYKPSDPHLFKSTSSLNVRKLFGAFAGAGEGDGGDGMVSGKGSCSNSPKDLEIMMFSSDATTLKTGSPDVQEYSTAKVYESVPNSKGRRATEQADKDHHRQNVYSEIYPASLSQFTESTSTALAENSPGSDPLNADGHSGGGNHHTVGNRAIDTGSSKSSTVKGSKRWTSRKQDLRKYSLNLIKSEYKSPTTGLTMNSDCESKLSPSSSSANATASGLTHVVESPSTFNATKSKLRSRSTSKSTIIVSAAQEFRNPSVVPVEDKDTGSTSYNLMRSGDHTNIESTSLSASFKNRPPSSMNRNNSDRNSGTMVQMGPLSVDTTVNEDTDEAVESPNVKPGLYSMSNRPLSLD